MKTRPLYLLLLLLSAILVVIAYRYEQYVVQRNFLIDVQAPCDPASKSCFVSDCSPTDDPACDTSPYDKVEILDSEAPACLEEHTCVAFSCEGYSNCSIDYCSEDTLEDGEACTPALTQDAGTEMTETATTTP